MKSFEIPTSSSLYTAWILQTSSSLHDHIVRLGVLVCFFSNLCHLVFLRWLLLRRLFGGMSKLKSHQQLWCTASCHWIKLRNYVKIMPNISIWDKIMLHKTDALINIFTLSKLSPIEFLETKRNLHEFLSHFCWNSPIHFNWLHSQNQLKNLPASSKGCC